MMNTSINGESAMAATPWLTVREAAARAKCGERSIYNGVHSGKLRAARLGGRRELRFLPEWVDAWLIETSTPVIVNDTVPRSVEVPGGRHYRR
jgi:excisionase family DNA binding protein